MKKLLETEITRTTSISKCYRHKYNSPFICVDAVKAMFPFSFVLGLPDAIKLEIFDEKPDDYRHVLEVRRIPTKTLTRYEWGKIWFNGFVPFKHRTNAYPIVNNIVKGYNLFYIKATIIK